MARHKKLARRWLLALCGILLAGLSACLGAPPAILPTASPDPTVVLALLGDVMLGRGVRASPETFAFLKPSLQEADLALENLESPLTNAGVRTGSFYALCADPANVSMLVDAGFDLFTLANNHHLDCGQDGLLETENTLEKAGLGYIGPGAEVVFRQVNGLQLAFLAFDATAEFNLEEACRAVSAAHKSGAIVIVAMHWGSEYQSGASPEQKQIAEQLVESGAALIWGHHPHVLQPSAWINSSLVLYSLGNALFDQGGLASTRRSALVLVTLDSTGVIAMQAIPFLIDVQASRIVQPDPESAAAISKYFK